MGEPVLLGRAPPEPGWLEGLNASTPGNCNPQAGPGLENRWIKSGLISRGLFCACVKQATHGIRCVGHVVYDEVAARILPRMFAQKCS